AADGGLARGALLLAWTYDKNEFARLRIQGVTPNRERQINGTSGRVNSGAPIRREPVSYHGCRNHSRHLPSTSLCDQRHDRGNRGARLPDFCDGTGLTVTIMWLRPERVAIVHVPYFRLLYRFVNLKW